MDEAMTERHRIREVIENWVLWRDQGDWARFRTVWHDDGWMMATWFQGPAERFIEVSREGWSRGVSILHFLGGSSIDIAGARAGSASGFMNMGAQLGGAVTALLTPVIAFHLGWTYPFIIAAALSAAGALAWLTVDPSRNLVPSDPASF